MTILVGSAFQATAGLRPGAHEVPNPTRARQRPARHHIFLSCILVLSGTLLAQPANNCPAGTPLGDTSASPSWNGWSPDASNARFQPASAAQLPADTVPQLKLKWAFGFPNVKAIFGAPTVVAGRVFLGVDTGMVYSLDAATGCVYWSFQADAGARSTITIDRNTAYFGDLNANAYALNAATGELVWRVHVDDHPSARITAAPKVFAGRVYV